MESSYNLKLFLKKKKKKRLQIYIVWAHSLAFALMHLFQVFLWVKSPRVQGMHHKCLSKNTIHSHYANNNSNKNNSNNIYFFKMSLFLEKVQTGRNHLVTWNEDFLCVLVFGMSFLLHALIWHTRKQRWQIWHFGK